jgi:hypothetical protein
MVRTRSGKGEYDEVPESSNSHRGAIRPPVPPLSPPTPPASLEQLLALLNAIMQRLAASDERQAGQSLPQESSYFNFLATQPPKFTETRDLLEANHWLHVTEAKFGLLHCSEFQKTLFKAQQLRGSASASWATYTVAI